MAKSEQSLDRRKNSITITLRESDSQRHLVGLARRKKKKKKRLRYFCTRSRDRSWKGRKFCRRAFFDIVRWGSKFCSKKILSFVFPPRGLTRKKNGRIEYFFRKKKKERKKENRKSSVCRREMFVWIEIGNSIWLGIV